MPARRRVTVLVIPETGRQTLSFTLRPAWLLTLPLIILGLSAFAYLQYQANQALAVQVAELDDLKRTNRSQEAQIEQVQSIVKSTTQQLEALQQLEEQIREITEQGLPVSRSGDTLPTTDRISGRGGPDEAVALSLNLPTLSAMLPTEVSGHLLGKRDTLPLYMAQPSYHRADAQRATQKAHATEQEATMQGTEIERLIGSLTVGKQAIVEHLDYIAHRPTGWPVSGALLTDRFGTRWSPFGWGQQHHEGIDLALGYGEPAVATAGGTVVHAGWLAGGYGYAVIIDHGYGFQTLYAHFSRVGVEVGDTVTRGDVIGWVGSTGNSTGPHVHYEVILNGVSVDPMKYAQ